MGTGRQRQLAKVREKQAKLKIMGSCLIAILVV
jgi:hypothetical protein